MANFRHSTDVPSAQNPVSFQNKCFSFATYMDQRLVYQGDNLYVSLIKDKKEWNKLKESGLHVTFGATHEAIISKTNLCPTEIPGICVSAWKTIDEDALNKIDAEFNFDFGKEFYYIMGTGFGSRACSRCKGVNCYFGCRTNSRAIPSPRIGAKKTCNHQYY